MKKLKILVAALLCLVGSNALAQTQETVNPEFNGHWFVSAHGGVQYTLGEASFGDLLSPTVQVSGGYQFTPWLATRLSVGAWQSKGGFSGYMVGGQPTTTTYKYNYVAPAIDVMFNLSNAIFGYNPERVFSVSAFVGGGANIGFGNDEANDLAAQGYLLSYNWEGTKVRAVGRGGLDLDFRVSDRISLGLEGSANILTDHYNSKKAGNADWYFNVMAGITIRLGKTKKAAPVQAAPIVPVAPVEEPQPEPKAEPKPEMKSEPEVKEFRRDVFFKINSSKVSDTELAKIKELALYLNNHIDAVVEITGYADAGTGTRSINERLSAERAESVKRVLVGECHIDASRILVAHKGDTVQPFAENDMNRVSICIISI
ncbi:ompA/MotB domain protein [Prevotella sp. CAG:1124]|nr:ompA/MotB domain protein [Prevotella sp. CAG:1124]